jgi:hypothetical protein
MQYEYGPPVQQCKQGEVKKMDKTYPTAPFSNTNNTCTAVELNLELCGQ